MTKTERLFHIVNYLRVNKTASIETLSKECLVSSRTTYRDVGDLEELGVATYKDNIIRLAKVETTPHWDLTAEEIDVTRFALLTSPLASHTYFQGKVKNIEVKLDKEYARVNKNAKRDRYFFATPPMTDLSKWAAAPKSQENLITYWKNMEKGRAVKITMKKSGRTPAKVHVGRGSQLSWSGGRWWYELVSNEGKDLRLDSNKVEVVQPERKTRKR